MHDLMTSLALDYKQDQSIYPSKEDLFKAFKATPYSDIRVVILGQEPYPNGRATGLAFANKLEFADKPSSTLKFLFDQTPSEGLGTNVDLLRWVNQGVLLLNTTLTTLQDQPGVHTEKWNTFTEKTIELISVNTSGLIFFLWGSHAQKFKPFINENLHYIFESEQATKECFIQANDILLKNNGPSYLIQW